MACEELSWSSQTYRFRGPPVWRLGGRSRFRVYLAAVISPDAGLRLVLQGERSQTCHVAWRAWLSQR
jgi:hypothetical protein